MPMMVCVPWCAVRCVRCRAHRSFIVIGPDFEWQAHGGVLAAGFYDETWGVAANSFLQC
jgi:hypothetical protein